MSKLSYLIIDDKSKCCVCDSVAVAVMYDNPERYYCNSCKPSEEFCVGCGEITESVAFYECPDRHYCECCYEDVLKEENRYKQEAGIED